MKLKLKKSLICNKMSICHYKDKYILSLNDFLIINFLLKIYLIFSKYYLIIKNKIIYFSAYFQNIKTITLFNIYIT